MRVKRGETIYVRAHRNVPGRHARPSNSTHHSAGLPGQATAVLEAEEGGADGLDVDVSDRTIFDRAHSKSSGLTSVLASGQGSMRMSTTTAAM